MMADRAGDVDELTRLRGDQDPRTIEQMIAEDAYGEVVVEKAERGEGGYTTISWDHGTTTSVKGPEVKVGDTVRFYGGAHLGDSHHGWALNGNVVEWQTPWERFAERVRWLADYDRRKRERIVAERRQVEQWLPMLRGPYRQRIERLQREDPTFDMDGATYETYPVLMAQRVEDWVRERHPDAAPTEWEQAVALVKEFEALPYKEQAPVLHAGQGDQYGVSGHQVDSALRMAAAVLCAKVI